MRIQNIVTLAFVLAATAGLAGCKFDMAVSKELLKHQASSVVALTDNGSFARTAKVVMPSIENDHSYSVVGSAIMPVWHLHPGASGIVNYAVSRRSDHVTVTLTFQSPVGITDAVLIDNGVCDSKLAFSARCSDVSPADWKEVYDAMVGFARKHGGAGHI